MAAFEELAEALRAAGVRRIEGRLIGHEGLFSGERRGDDWSWGDLVWGYGAEVSALSFNDNVASVTVRPGEHEGDPVLLEASPRSSYYSVACTAVTTSAGAKRDLTLVRDPGSNRIRITGTLPIGETWEGRVALEDPARYAATVFGEVLAAKGIVVAGGVDTTSEPMPGAVRVLAAHDSPPMSEIVKVVNKVSQNLHTEMLLRLLGAKSRAKGAWPTGHEAVQAFLGRLGVATDWGRCRTPPACRAPTSSPRTGWRACSRGWSGIATRLPSATACPWPAWTARSRTGSRGRRRRAGSRPRRARSATSTRSADT